MIRFEASHTVSLNWGGSARLFLCMGMRHGRMGGSPHEGNPAPSLLSLHTNHHTCVYIFPTACTFSLPSECSGQPTKVMHARLRRLHDRLVWYRRSPDHRKGSYWEHRL